MNKLVIMATHILTSFIKRVNVNMTKKALKILFLFLSLPICKSYAGWYECYNFKGNIDNWRKSEKNYNIIGVYKYDRYNSPIRLEGKINPCNNNVVLYEIANEKHTAVFEF
ncbi:MAG: hypothetical protein EOO43_11525 [Flavobacterium sp.]|nr:MAG: hypothetical protein EOO43_11525 [Flavobacterium sp.]